MGALLGGIIGGIGNYAAARTQAAAQDRAAQTALTGYNYLRGSEANNQFISNGQAANSAQSQLLGLTPMGEGAQNGFQNYLNSTGYKFNLQQGTDAVVSQNAARGMLNSGATGKALMDYGQNIGSQYFNNYLAQLGGISQQGQASVFAPANAAASGSSAAAQAIAGGGAARADGINSLFGTAANYFNTMTPIGAPAGSDPSNMPKNQSSSERWHL